MATFKGKQLQKLPFLNKNKDSNNSNQINNSQLKSSPPIKKGYSIKNSPLKIIFYKQFLSLLKIQESMLNDITTLIQLFVVDDQWRSKTNNIAMSRLSQ